MAKFKILLVCAALAIGSNAIADDPARSGNDFLSTEQDMRMFWMGYIAGVYSAITSDIYVPAATISCMNGPDVTRGQLFDVVKKYIKNNPEQRHNHMYAITVVALVDVCKEAT